MTQTGELIYRQATIEEIFELRLAVLRAGLEADKLHFAGDEAGPPTAWHFGAFVAGASDKNVGCLTLFESVWEGAPAFQLRGMAAAADWRGRGVGKRLLEVASETVANSACRNHVWWCNARVPAIPFYEKSGWAVVSDEFDIAGAGPHRKMRRSVVTAD